MLNTILCDLDGTLLPLDLAEFTKGYFGAIAPRLSGYTLPTDSTRWLLDATTNVVMNEDPSKTNLEKFRQALFSDIQQNVADEIWAIFDAFYENEFDLLQCLTQPTKIAREICRMARKKGYQLALATNPIFPMAATLARIRWAGLDEADFALITTMDNMHFSKPSPKYYLEVLDILHVSPADCLMVGNDVQEDGAATYLGIDTYLVTDCLIDRGVGTFPFVEEGQLSDLLRYVEQLPEVASA